jgi:pimeloyl-ACP methyl ester carboxylesterase
MDGQRFEVEVPGGTLVGTVLGTGPPVLLLHGGPGLDGDYLDALVPELSDAYTVACYQQRGLPPSTAAAPYDVPEQVADVARVLDGLGWDRAVVVGHSWGGHLLLNALASIPDRLLAAVVVDPLGGVGDGGEAEFGEELTRRVPEQTRSRAEELDARAMAGEGTAEDALDSFRLYWPSYFADPSCAPPAPDGLRMSVDAYAQTWDSAKAGLPSLAGRLAGCTVPTVFVHGGASPMPVSASTDTAAAIGAAATVVVLDDTGHMVWHESPGAVRAALDALLAGEV